jgi:hypothetical protein
MILSNCILIITRKKVKAKNEDYSIKYDVSIFQLKDVSIFDNGNSQGELAGTHITTTFNNLW